MIQRQELGSKIGVCLGKEKESVVILGRSMHPKAWGWAPLEAQANGDIGYLKRKAQGCTLLWNDSNKAVKRGNFNNQGNPVSGEKDTGLGVRRRVAQPGLTSGTVTSTEFCSTPEPHFSVSGDRGCQSAHVMVVT